MTRVRDACRCIGYDLRMLLARLASRVNGRRAAGEPPLEPGTYPWLGSAIEFGSDLPALLDACRRKHGDVFTLVVAGKRVTFVLDPLDFPEVLRRVDDLSFSALTNDIGIQAFDYSRATDTPPVIDGIHDLYSAHLKATRLAPLSDSFAAHLDPTLAAATPAGWTTRSLFQFVDHIVFTAGTDALFGAGTADPTLLAAFRRLDAAFPLLAAGVPARLLPGVRRARRLLAARVGPLRPDASDFIARRDAMFLTHVDRRDRDHLQLGLLWAAQANTIPAAFWTLAYVLADATARNDLRAEIDPLLIASGGVCTREQLRAMTRLDSAVSEALRLATNSLTMRLVLRPTVLDLDSGRWSLRQGDRLCIAPSVTHRDPALFPEPERYRHDRFIGAQFIKRGKKVGLAFMPYGGGVSMCPGRYLAHEEVKHLVARVLHRLDVELLGPLPPLDGRRAGLGVLPPRGALMVRMRPRARAV